MTVIEKNFSYIGRFLFFFFNVRNVYLYIFICLFIIHTLTDVNEKVRWETFNFSF